MFNHLCLGLTQPKSYTHLIIPVKPSSILMFPNLSLQLGMASSITSNYHVP